MSKKLHIELKRGHGILCNNRFVDSRFDIIKPSDITEHNKPYCCKTCINLLEKKQGD